MMNSLPLWWDTHGTNAENHISECYELIDVIIYVMTPSRNSTQVHPLVGSTKADDPWHIHRCDAICGAVRGDPPWAVPNLHE